MEARGGVLTVGNFDGVHIGHRQLIGRVVERAREQGLPSVVFTFDPHPVQVLYPERGLKRLFTFADQQEQLAALGVDFLVVQPFSRDFSQLAPHDFVQTQLISPFQPAAFIVGHDFAFGASRSGSLEFLQNFCAQKKLELQIVTAVEWQGQVVSSSRIRKSLETGALPEANTMLGRRFYIRGLVVRGEGRGRTLGFPTANLHTEAPSLPETGVYVVQAQVVPSQELRPAVVNIGRTPTFNTLSSDRVEAHLLDYSGDLYGYELRLEFVSRLRPEQKFSGVEALREQIAKDILAARRLLEKK